MATELVPGVYDLPVTAETPAGERTFHPAVVDTDRGPVLVDAGLPTAVEGLRSELADAGIAVEEVATVLVTHHDGDHVGGLPAVVEASGAAVFAHPEEAPYVDGREPPLKGGEAPPPVPVDVEVVDGVRLRTDAGPMVLVGTPGHSPGHLSAYVPEHGLLLAGDAMVSEGGALGPPKPEYTPDPETAMDSVGRLAELDVAATLCYHGGYVEEGTEAIAAVAAGDRE